MREPQKYLLIILFSCIFICCQRRPRHTGEWKEIQHVITQKSPLFSDRYFSLKIDSANNYLHILLQPKENLKSFPFPKDADGKTLSGTAFNFSFCINGQTITGAGLPNLHARNTYFGYGKWLQDLLIFSSDTLDLLTYRPIEFEIPFFAFNKLKGGDNTITLKCSQKVFCSPEPFEKLYIDQLTKDSSYKRIRYYSKGSLLSFDAQLTIKVPKIFKTSIYGHGIRLRNDSVFSPVGMDNTIWKSSYPDVYWTINYPDDNFYCSSDFKTSTDNYDIQDTFYLFHYTPNDSIALGVWDHDNLSRDDYIAWKRFSLNQFSKEKMTYLSFDNIKLFKIKMEREGLINR